MRRSALLLLTLVAACQVTPATTAQVDVYEFGIDPSTGVLTSGAVELEITNTGQFGHTLVITDATGGVISAGDLIPPNEMVAMSIELPAGDYRFTCRIVAQDREGNVIDHFEKGMVADVTVTDF